MDIFNLYPVSTKSIKIDRYFGFSIIARRNIKDIFNVIPCMRKIRLYCVFAPKSVRSLTVLHISITFCSSIKFLHQTCPYYVNMGVIVS